MQLVRHVIAKLQASMQQLKMKEVLWWVLMAFFMARQKAQKYDNKKNKYVKVYHEF
jgi:hypothetical protein